MDKMGHYYTFRMMVGPNVTIIASCPLLDSGSLRGFGRRLLEMLAN